MRSIDGLSYKEAAGYWMNTYVPGDPTVRSLHTALLRPEPQIINQLLSSSTIRLHRAAVQYAQPFDAPKNAALAVYLHSDRTGLDGQGRMLVQIGLQAADRRGGQNR